MNSDAKSKLAAVLERRDRDRAAEAAEELTRQTAASEAEARREAVRERWNGTKNEIAAAIEAVNAEIASIGMTLSWSEKPRGGDCAGLAQLFIKLEEQDYEKERQIVFNVSALGLVQLVTLIPHTGKRIPDFKIDEVTGDHYEGVIVEFIDQCISKKR